MLHAFYDLNYAERKISMYKICQLLFLLLNIHCLVVAQENYNDKFFKAASHGDINLIRSYVDKGFDINSQDKIGRTALMYAAAYEKVEVVEFLLDNHAHSFIVDVWGKTALTLSDYQEWGQSPQRWLKNKTIIEQLKLADINAHKKSVMIQYHKISLKD